MALRGPAAHLRRAADWRRSGDETYWEGLKAEMEVVPRASRTPPAPRPQSAIEAGQMDGWLQQLERMQGSHFGSTIRDKVPPFYDKIGSMPSLPNEPVGSSRETQNLPYVYSGDLSSCGTPSMSDISLAGSRESLKAGMFHTLERRGSWEKAFIKQAPGTEQAKLSSLAPVRIGWLPIQRKVIAADSPHKNSHLETPASQVKLKQPITPTFLKNPGKINGFRHTDGEVERSQTRPDEPMSVKTWRLPEQESSTVQQASEKGGSTTGESERLLGWQALRKFWAIDRTSPLNGGAHSNDVHSGTKAESCGTRSLPKTSSGEPCRAVPLPHRALSAPTPHAASQTPCTGTLVVPKTSFSSITISSRKVTRTSSLPGSSRPSSPGEQASFPTSSAHPQAQPDPETPSSNPVTLRRKATIVKVTAQRMSPGPPVPHLNGTQGPGTPPGMNEGCETVVRRRKATIIKVTEHRESYSAGKGGSGSRPTEYRHSYTEGVYQENSFWQQGSLEPQLHHDAPSNMHVECSPDGTNSSLNPNRATAVALRDPERGSTLHRSSMCLFVSHPPAREAPTGTIGGDRSERPRPLSCYANVFGNSAPCKETIGTQATPRKWNTELPGWTHHGAVKDTAHGLQAGSPIGAGIAPSKTGQPVGQTPEPGRDDTERYSQHQQQQEEQKEEKEKEEEEEVEVRSQPPFFTLLQAPEPKSQQAPEAILALNAAAIIANIKLQSQLDKKTKPNGHSAKELNFSPRGNIQVRKVVACEKPRTDHSSIRRDPGVPPNPSSLNTPHTELVPQRPDLKNSRAKSLSLKEALELSRPDFISRSQARLRKLERRALERRGLQESYDLQADATLRHKRGHCTIPSPQSDNLFRPRDRAITGKEMQLRSKRNYNNLPEVRRKREEENKRVVSHINRQRVELFKKADCEQSHCAPLYEPSVLTITKGLSLATASRAVPSFVQPQTEVPHTYTHWQAGSLATPSPLQPEITQGSRPCLSSKQILAQDTGNLHDVVENLLYTMHWRCLGSSYYTQAYQFPAGPSRYWGGERVWDPVLVQNLSRLPGRTVEELQQTGRDL